MLMCGARWIPQCCVCSHTTILMYKSQCKRVSLLGLVTEQDIQTEIQIDEQQQETKTTRNGVKYFIWMVYKMILCKYMVDMPRKSMVMVCTYVH